MRDLDELKKIISTLDGRDLSRVKELADQQLEIDYYKKENFMLHEKKDDYLYEVLYSDNTKVRFYIGQRAYKEYQDNKRAIAVYRVTKDLFPIRELLLERKKRKG